jgi:hypothetical protein
MSSSRSPGCKRPSVGRIAGLARGFCRDQRSVADEIHLGGDGDVEHRAVVLGRDLVNQRQREIRSSGCMARSSTEWPCTLVTWVRGSITVAPDLSFMFWRGMTAPTYLPSAAICMS